MMTWATMAQQGKLLARCVCHCMQGTACTQPSDSDSKGAACLTLSCHCNTEDTAKALRCRCATRHIAVILAANQLYATQGCSGNWDTLY
eukprot:3771655-Amphidinium_carterae.1